MSRGYDIDCPHGTHWRACRPCRAAYMRDWRAKRRGDYGWSPETRALVLRLLEIARGLPARPADANRLKAAIVSLKGAA